MKSMIAFSLLVAGTVAQIATPYGGYASAYGYNAVTPGRTAFDVFNLNPYHAYGYANNYGYAYANAYANAYAASPYNNFYNGFVANPVATVAAVPAVAVAPAAAVAAEPAVLAKAVAAADVAEVIEAAAPVVAAPQLRPIFPIFGSDLRGGNANIQFARPGQIISIEPETEVTEADDVVVISPAASVRSAFNLAPSTNRFFPGAHGFYGHHPFAGRVFA